MNANELMVGDWVYVTYPTYPIPAIVEAISPREGSAEGYTFQLRHRHKPNEVYFVRKGMVKPIPLTPEILEKNGFNYEKTHDVWILEYGEIIIEVGAYHPDFINVSYKQMTPDGIIEGDISSISKVDGSDIMTHELQHALRLCGIDKEIEL